MDRRLRRLERASKDGSLDSLQRYYHALEQALQINIEPFPEFVAPDNSRSRTRDEVEFALRTIHGTEIWTNARDYVRVHDMRTGNLIPGCHFTHDEWVNGLMGSILAQIRWRGTTNMGQESEPADEIEEQANYLRELKRLVLREIRQTLQARDRTYQYIHSLEQMMAGASPIPPIVIDPDYDDNIIIRGANNRELRTDTLYTNSSADDGIYYFANAGELQDHCDELDTIDYMPAWWEREGYYRLNFDEGSVEYLGPMLEASYIRITDYHGVEIVYWVVTEWEDDPEEVMGAILGAFGVERVRSPH